jgi:hypothetical protein
MQADYDRLRSKKYSKKEYQIVKDMSVDRLLKLSKLEKKKVQYKDEDLPGAAEMVKVVKK